MLNQISLILIALLSALPAPPGLHEQAPTAPAKPVFENGQAQANELHYVPLPAKLVKQIEAYWATDLK